ncbi:DUF692 domain-containing protein [Candidatus Berkiella cookevillensis]|uniref:DUF692 domain-containing protein n=1 Tax=Candidatus Berkiella cookevillensis TaxID=437022 RepID=A0A0Q9YAK1_9GAMM|nr:DUF692 domain-containing protein [Candidatus Berkiella cookevillensis]MCS5709527.1 DUF692 domain-containing protein [Candidatus Berkiella cookevillensis]
MSLSQSQRSDSHRLEEEITGVGLGLRAQHYKTILETRPLVPWFEVISENYLAKGALAMRHLEAIRAHYPIVLHGVSLSIGSTDPLNQSYLKSLKALKSQIDAAWISDHLCWSSFSHQYVPDLWPLPFEDKAIRHVVERILKVQDYLQERILLENISSYLQFTHSVLPEWEFISTIAAQADCYLLLDINNIYVNAMNHNFDPRLYIDAIPPERVKQLHLGGFERKEAYTHSSRFLPAKGHNVDEAARERIPRSAQIVHDWGERKQPTKSKIRKRRVYLLDTHGQAVHTAVWELFQYAQLRFHNVPVCIEWDNNIPDFNVLLDEAKKAKHIMDNVEVCR